jgi:hypothetical protein
MWDAVSGNLLKTDPSEAEAPRRWWQWWLHYRFGRFRRAGAVRARESRTSGSRGPAGALDGLPASYEEIGGARLARRRRVRRCKS